MAVESPTNCWTIAEAKIITALANSARFQELAESDDEVEAALKIYGEQVVKPDNGHNYTLEELQNMKSYGQVYSADEVPYGKQWQESWLAPFGTAIIYLERLVTEYEQNGEIPFAIERKWKNLTGDIIDQVASYLRDNSGPFIKSFAVSAGPGLNDRDKWDANGMWQGIEFTLEWGY